MVLPCPRGGAHNRVPLHWGGEHRGLKQVRHKGMLHMRERLPSEPSLRPRCTFPCFRSEDDRESLQIKKCPSQRKRAACGFQVSKIQCFSFWSFSQSTNTYQPLLWTRLWSETNIHDFCPQGAHRPVTHVHRGAAKSQGTGKQGGLGVGGRGHPRQAGEMASNQGRLSQGFLKAL